MLFGQGPRRRARRRSGARARPPHWYPRRPCSPRASTVEVPGTVAHHRAAVTETAPKTIGESAGDARGCGLCPASEAPVVCGVLRGPRLCIPTFHRRGKPRDGPQYTAEPCRDSSHDGFDGPSALRRSAVRDSPQNAAWPPFGASPHRVTGSRRRTRATHQPVARNCSSTVVPSLADSSSWSQSTSFADVSKTPQPPRPTSGDPTLA